MKDKPTIRDVARTAGVSLGTVSRVINGQRYVAGDMRQRVRQAMDTLGYQPNAIAQSMRTRATRMIGFMIVDVSNPVFGSAVKAAQEVLHDAGYTMLLANSGGRPANEVELVTFLQQRQVDGLIMMVTVEQHPALLEALRNVKVPVVLLDREVGLPFDAVYVDHAKGMRQATEYLLRLGHRRIALITASQTIRPGRERLRGFQQAFHSFGLKPDPALIRCDSLSAEYGFREAYALLAAKQAPTAMIAGGNQTLGGVLKAVSMLDIKIPGQLSLISCDDTDLASFYSPPITVIDRDLDELGRTSAELLLHRLRGDTDSERRNVMLPTNLVLRPSCLPPVPLLPADAVPGSNGST